MAFEKKVPEWLAQGVEPPESLKRSGFQPGYKPPADYFNWFWFSVSEALTELQNDAVAHYTGMVTADYTFNDALTRGKYLVSGANINGAPYTGNVYGTLFVFMADNKKEWTGGNLYWLTQIFVSTNGEFFTRRRINSDNFSAWSQFYTSDNKPTLNELSGVVSIAKGGTDATTASQALLNLGAAAKNHAHSEYQESITGAATTITSSNLTANRAMVSNSSGKIAASTVTSTELGYLDGVTSAIQTQLNDKAASKHTHSADEITGLPSSVDAYSKTEVDNMLSGKAPSSHNQAASTITTGIFPTTAIYAKTGTDYTTARIRNIKASTADLTAGTSALPSGDIYLVYE